MTEPLSFLHGRMMPQSDASLRLNDAGFVYGATVTDLCRTIRHRLYRWSDHLARFRRSCALTGISVGPADDEITRRAHELVEHNATFINVEQDLALVLLATPGPIGYYLGQSTVPGEEPTFGMHTFPLPFVRFRPWIEQGVRLVTPQVRQVPGACIDPCIKHRSRLHWWLAGKAIAHAPQAQALLLDVDGHITETASSNFLLAKNGVLFAPPRECVLGGVSLHVVSELCAKLHIGIEHRPLTLEECYAADEALLTCTSYGIAGVCAVNDRAIPWPGPMLRRLVEAWSEEVGVDIHQQIIAGSS